jgi:hypothetical protein
MKYNNPPEKAIVKFTIIMFVIMIIIGMLGLISNWGPYDGIIGFIVVVGGWSIFIIITWYREYYIRPTIVEIADFGVILYMRYSKNVQLAWSEILGIFAYSDDTSIIKSKDGIGSIIPYHGPRYWTTYSIANIISSEYNKSTGKQLPRENLNETTRDFRKRVVDWDYTQRYK